MLECSQIEAGYDAEVVASTSQSSLEIWMDRRVRVHGVAGCKHDLVVDDLSIFLELALERVVQGL